jgi:sugar lactone lactonase YvrE
MRISALLKALNPKRHPWAFALVAFLLMGLPASTAQPEKSPWLYARAYHIPSEYTNQESGYFSIIEGKNSRLYIGCAKYSINAFLVEFNPLKAVMRMVVDVHRVIGMILRGFAAQAKIHTRNNVGASGKIYFGSKQGYPEKGENRSDYPGGYVLVYDPKTDKTENYGIPIKHQGVISVMPDESRGVAYISTCDDGRPIESSHFMILDLKKKTYRDLGDCQHSYAFIVLDHKGRAYHPVRGGLIARYDPETDKLDKLPITVDGFKPPEAITKDGAVLNWETSPDRKTLYAIEMSTNQLFSFDLTASVPAIPGRSLGQLLPGAPSSDCRALAVGSTGIVWATVTQPGKNGQEFHLVNYRPGASAPRDLGPVAIANPDYTPFTDAKGKPLPWHHAIRKEKDGAMTPLVPLGICAGHDGSVYALTLAPFTLLHFSPQVLAAAEKR